MNTLPVTVVIPTKNESSNLRHCIERLSSFAEIWVVDSHSSDDTCTIAAEAGARVLAFNWQGGFPKKRNWILMNEKFTTPWVLFLDADEQVSTGFVDELARLLPNTHHSGFWLNYTTHFMGKILKYGVPQRKLALFRVGAGLYERIDDPGWSHLDMEVHEHPVLDGSLGEVRSQIDHRDFRGITHFIDRHNSYSTWEASRYVQLTSNDPASNAHALTTRQRLKYRLLRRWWFASAYFIAAYFFKLGLLDGGAGFDYALLKMAYFQNIRLKLIEIERTKYLDDHKPTISS
jgi:glycosyltransferase involved in cell wall biosynthesis